MSRLRESPYYGIKKALTEAEQHTYVRCSLHNHDRDALVEVRHHLAVIRELAEDIIPWARDYAVEVASRRAPAAGDGERS